MPFQKYSIEKGKKPREIFMGIGFLKMTLGLMKCGKAGYKGG